MAEKRNGTSDKLPMTHLNTEEWTNDMDSGFFLNWRRCTVLGQFDNATGYPLQFSYILAAFADYSADLQWFEWAKQID